MCGSMKADPAARGAGTTSERASVSSDESCQLRKGFFIERPGGDVFASLSRIEACA